MEALKGKLYDLLVAIEEVEAELKKVKLPDPFENATLRFDLKVLPNYLRNPRVTALKLITQIEENKK